MLRNVAIGLVAGAAGTAALNITTYLDMLVRARPGSSVPATVAGEMADRAGVESLSVQNEGEEAQNRRSGAGALLGFATGLGIGAGYGALRSRLDSVPVYAGGPSLGVAAIVGSDAPAAAFNVTNPTSWGPNAWLSDIVPHMIYGVVTAATYERLAKR